MPPPADGYVHNCYCFQNLYCKIIQTEEHYLARCSLLAIVVTTYMLSAGFKIVKRGTFYDFCLYSYFYTFHKCCLYFVCSNDFTLQNYVYQVLCKVTFHGRSVYSSSLQFTINRAVAELFQMVFKTTITYFNFLLGYITKYVFKLRVHVKLSSHPQRVIFFNRNWLT